MRVRVSVRIDKSWETATPLLDSGAEVNLIHPRLLTQKQLDQLDNHVAVSALFNATTEPLGSCDLFVKVVDAFKETSLIQQRFVVADTGPLDMILGFPWLEQADPIISWSQRTFVFPMKPTSVKLCVTKKELRKAIEEARHVVVAIATPVINDKDENKKKATLPPEFDDYMKIFTTPDPFVDVNEHAHAIELESDEIPRHVRIYPLAEPELKVLREYLDDALAKGWIQPSISPTGAPILFVPKKGGKLRLCVDYRALNRITRKNRMPLPLISEILDRLSKAKIYTKLDLKDAYHRLRIKPGDEWKTAFRCRYGHFEYRVLPFGLANAPATWQAFINEVLGDLVDTICIVYLDDILIYSQNHEEHTQHVRSVLDRLQQHKLFVNLDKCDFRTTQVDFLGYLIDPQGIRMEPQRIEAIKSWPTPTSIKDIQIFLGFAGFYRRFIKGYSKVTAPLTELFKGNTTGPVDLSPIEFEAFAKLRLLFSRAPFLRHYETTLPTRLETDASAFAIGGVLTQQHEGRWHPVAFLSRKLKEAELRYDTPDAEMMAIIECFRVWRPYLAYVQQTVEVLTDHLNHQYLATKAKLSARQARWMEELAAFDFIIKYREGKKNPADGLSRRPDHWDRNEVAEAKSAPLANFLNHFHHSIALSKRSCAAPTTSLVRSLSISNTVGLAQGFTRLVACYFLCEGPAYLLQRRGQRRGTFQCGRLELNSPKTTSEPRVFTTSVVGDVSRESHTPWPRTSITSLEARTAELAPLTATSQLLPPLIEALQQAQQRDAFVTQEEWKRWRTRGDTAGSNWTIKDSLLRYKGRVYVPNEPGLRQELLRLFHDAPTAGHQGTTKTKKRLVKSYFWQSLDKDVRQYVSTCAVCQRTKARTHLPYGELALLPIPHEPWREISLDFITQLPPSINEAGKHCNAILVIVDRFTKYSLYIPTSDRLTSEGLATTLLHHIFRQFGIPDGIVSDRGSLFTSKFWAAFCWHLATTRRLSTAFHPQTDGQTERQNQSVEHYLRTYCGFAQDDWALKLCLAQFVYNTSWHSAINTSPAMALFGFNPRGPNDIPPDGPQTIKAPAADERANMFRTSREAIVAILEHSRSQYQKWYNSGRKQYTFAIGDWVLISTKHLRQKRPSRKLSDKYIGPYQIENIIQPHGLACKLRLPSTMKLYPTFPITHLEPYRARDSEPPTTPQEDLILDDSTYEVEAILGHKGNRRNRSYLIKWKGYDSEENSWEPRTNINDGPLLQNYENHIKHSTK